MGGRSISGYDGSVEGSDVLRDRLWGGLVDFMSDGMDR